MVARARGVVALLSRGGAVVADVGGRAAIRAGDDAVCARAPTAMLSRVGLGALLSAVVVAGEGAYGSDGGAEASVRTSPPTPPSIWAEGGWARGSDGEGR